jgi:hypothetical protein
MKYEDVTRSSRTGRLEREPQIVYLSTTRCSCIAILLVSIVSFAAIVLCVASQRVFIVVSVYFVIDSVRKLLDTPSYVESVLWIVMLGYFAVGSQRFEGPCCIHFQGEALGVKVTLWQTVYQSVSQSVSSPWPLVPHIVICRTGASSLSAHSPAAFAHLPIGSTFFFRSYSLLIHLGSLPGSDPSEWTQHSLRKSCKIPQCKL